MTYRKYQTLQRKAIHRKKKSSPWDIVFASIVLASFIFNSPLEVGGSSLDEINKSWEKNNYRGSYTTSNGTKIYPVNQVAGDSLINPDGTFLNRRSQQLKQQQKTKRTARY